MTPIINTTFKKQIAFLLLLVLFIGQLYLLSPSTAEAAQITALLHMDGSDTSTTFTESCNLITTTVSGNAQIDTAQSKFGGASGLFDGTSDMVTMADGSDWDFGNGSFTIDFWFRPANTTAGLRMLVGQHTMGVVGAFAIYQSGTNVVLHLSSNGTSWDVANGTVAASSIVAGTWYHIAVVKNGTNVKSYQDGVQVANFTTAATLTNAAHPLRIGSGSTGEYFNGHIEEVRISKGIAQWTAAFTPPTTAYSTCLSAVASGQTTFTQPVTINENAVVSGNIYKGSGTFVIDHPLDPANKMLFHSFVESPDVKNIYDGIVKLDARGIAKVKLPSYFQALNESERFLLTPIGTPAPDLFIQSEGVVDNSFTIVGGPPNARISWQVTGIRKDPYILANPVIPEVEKSEDAIINKGKFLFKDYPRGN